MAGPIAGITGAITSWSGTTNAYLAGTGLRANQATLTMEGEEIDTTAFADVGVETAIKGLTGWSIDFEAHLASPAHGAAGLVTFSAGTVLNLNTYNLEIEGKEFNGTAFAATEQAWYPGGFLWRGDFSGFLDASTAVTAPSNSSEPATGTFKYQEQGATDSTLSGSIFTHRLTVGASPVALNTYAYSFRGSGALTQSTPSAGNGIIPTGALPVATAGSLVFTASTGRTFTGSAFWTRIALSCSVGQAVKVKVRARGAGALVIA